MLSRKELEKLYLKDKKSSAEIAKMLKCSVHKVDYWLKVYNIAKRSIADAIYIKHNPTGDPFFIKNPKTVDEGVLYGIGLGLYWGEGNKKNKTSLRIGSTEPKIIMKFIEFLRKFFAIEKKKIRFGLQIFSDINPKHALVYWQKYLNVSSTQFQKIIVTPARSLGTYREKSKYGVLTLYFHNRNLRNILVDTLENL